MFLPDGRAHFLAAIDHPSVWLVVPTITLLIGQAAAGLPVTVGPEAALLLAVPLTLVLRPRYRTLVLLIGLGGLAFAVGYSRHRGLLLPQFPADHVRSIMRDGARFHVEGTLGLEPEKLPNRDRWLFRAERIWHPTGAQEINGDVLINVRHVRREWHYGDRVRLWLRPGVPRDSGNPDGFNYATFLARRGIYTTGFLESDAEVEMVARNADPLRGTIEHLRRQIRSYIDDRFSRPTGALMKALVVGDMGGISKEMRTAFTAAGVNHVLSISGLHVAMLGVVVFMLIRWGCALSSYLLLRCNVLKVATFFSFCAVLFYTALAGAMVPTVRSAIMIGVYEIAVLLDREEEVFTSLTLAALLIGLLWPAVITDISFQLSFLAVLSIVWGMRKLHNRTPAARPEQLPQERSWLKDKCRSVLLTLAVPLFATIGTAPLIAHYFGHLSLAGLVANPIVVPLIGLLVVPLGLSIGISALVLPGAAGFLVWPAERLLTLSIWLVERFSQLPLANISVPAPDMVEVAGLYLLIVFAMLTLARNRYALVLLCLITTALSADCVYWWLERWNRKEFRVTHLNVGNGDAAVLEFPGSKVLLLDAGGTGFGDFDTGEAIVAPFLRSRKILKLDYAVVSHARVDHYGGMRAVVNEFNPSEFWSGGGKARTSLFAQLENTLANSAVMQVRLSADGSCRPIGDAKLCVLSAPAEENDDASIAFRVEVGRVSFLFAGDIDKQVEGGLLKQKRVLESDVLKVPRHGSASSSTQEFVATVRPKLAIISVGARNAQGLPRPEVLERYRNVGAQILRTDEDGAIIIRTDGETLWYETYKSGKRGVLKF